MLDGRAAALARRQHSVISRQQLIHQCHLTDGQVEGLVSRGALDKVLFGVYRVRGAEVTPEQRAMAAQLRCWPRARVVGPMILGLLGARGFSARDQFAVLVPPGRRVHNVPFPVWGDLDEAADRAMVGELQTVRGARAILEAVRLLPRDDDALRAIDAGRWARIASCDDLLRRARQLRRRHPGARRVLALYDAGHLEQESGGERALAAALAPLDLDIEWQVWVAPDIRVDALVRDIGLVIEYLGEEFHDGVIERSRDARRDARLRAMGHVVLYVTKADVANEAALRAQVRAVVEALRLRTAL